MERKTNKIITKESKIEVEFYTFITGGEMRQIQDIFLADAEFSVQDKGQSSMNAIKANLMNVAQDKTFELMILSVGGIKENVAEEMSKLPLKDYDEIVTALNEITNIKKDESDTLKG